MQINFYNKEILIFYKYIIPQEKRQNKGWKKDKIKEK